MTLPNDFRQYLQQELILRCKKNSRYSLRSYAKQLGIDASTLSKILSGKRAIGKKTIMQLGTKVGLNAKQVDAYLKTLKISSDEDTESGIDTFQQLALDQFAVISDWYHFAIMELLSVRDFNPDRAWIAKALGIRTVEVDAAVERLVRVGMLEISSDGEWMDHSSGVTTNIGPDMMSSAHRRLQEQFLQKAIEALSEVALEQRDHTAMTMAMDSSKLPEARARIAKFRRSLARFLNEGDTKDSVFNLNVALFPLTELKPRRKT